MMLDLTALLDRLTGRLEMAEPLGDAIRVLSVLESSGVSSFGVLGVAVPDWRPLDVPD